MGKDLFTSFVTPLKKEFREEDCIDDFLGIPKLNIPNIVIPPARDCLLNDAIINYNNEIVVAKVFYVFARKYKKLYEEKSNEDYDFWMRKFMEQTIKELYSIYDKSMHIINYLYDLQVKQRIKFSKKIMQSLKDKDAEFYSKVNDIYNTLYDNDKNGVRNDITHNISCLFPSIDLVIKDGRTSWIRKEAMTIEQADNMIEEISVALKKQMTIITNKIYEKYPKKDEKELKEFIKKHQDEMNQKLGLNKK